MSTATPAATEWDTAVGTGLLRLGVGAALLRWRTRFARLAGAAEDDRGMRLLFGYFGVRDMTLGVSALAASRPGGDVARQLTWQGVADTVDGAVIGALVAGGRLPRVRGLGMVAVAAVSAAGEYAAAWRLRHRR
jgi:hypothetical protein